MKDISSRSSLNEKYDFLKVLKIGFTDSLKEFIYILLLILNIHLRQVVYSICLLFEAVFCFNFCGRSLSLYPGTYNIWLETGRSGNRGSIPARSKVFFL
jgi:hypothetical protein